MNEHAPAPNADPPGFLGVLQPHKDLFASQDIFALLLHRKLPPSFNLFLDL
jgi:hypothetical protein